MPSIMKKNRPVLKEEPLRNAGQSLNIKMFECLFVIMGFQLGVVFFLSMIAFSWIDYFSPTKGPPIFNSLLFGAGGLICALFAIRSWRSIKKYQIGRDGEMAVGQLLERLRGDQAHIYHDILGDGFNIDHVVVNPKGIFAIETKTYSKPSKGRPEVHYDGESIIVGGYNTRDKILKQAEASAREVQKILLKQTKRDYPVRPVVLFPGWYVLGKNYGKSTCWVLNPVAFFSWLENENETLQPQDFRAAFLGLSDHIRASERERKKK